MKIFAAVLCVCTFALCQGAFADDLENSLESYHEVLKGMDLTMERCEIIGLDKTLYDEYDYQLSLTMGLYDSLKEPQISLTGMDEYNLHMFMGFCSLYLYSISFNWGSAFLMSNKDEFLDKARSCRTGAQENLDTAWGYYKILKKENSDSGGGGGCFIIMVK
jgi:hypothetical protein